MMRIFYPQLLKKDITAITIENLRKLGVKGLLLDVDNTLTYHSSQYLDPKVKEWLGTMKKAGFKMIIVSNAFNKRVAPFAKALGMDYIAFSCKPLPFGFIKAAKKLGLPKDECVAIGDQTFTDILGAKFAGVKQIQVLPVKYDKNKPTLQFKRMLEKKILKRYRKYKNIDYTDK